MIGVELVGGPADGQLWQVQDPPPLYLTVIVGPRLPAWDPDPEPAAVLGFDTVIYRIRATWNPRTRARQYVVC